MGDPQRRDFCPVHGVTDGEQLLFLLDGEADAFCLRCWRDWARATLPPLREAPIVAPIVGDA